MSGRGYWDEQAASFDTEADHGLRDPVVRAAWLDLLTSQLPPRPTTVADIGCGTGTLSVLLAEAGHSVVGVDFSSRMVAKAASKSRRAGVRAMFAIGDATSPPLADAAFDVVLARHVLWALPQRVSALAAWVRLLRPGGRLILIEGLWSTGGGMPAQDLLNLVAPFARSARSVSLQADAFWGKPIDDERYLVRVET